MKTIKYDMSENYFKCYNESQGIMVNKKKVLKNQSGKVFGYLENGLVLLLYTILISILSKLIWFLDNGGVFSEVLSIFVMLSFLLVVIYYLSFLIAYFHENKKSHRGKLVIDEEGITDISEEKVKVGLPWDKIKAVVISKNTITIMTESPVYFFVSKDLEEKLIKLIEKHKENLPIIEK